MCKRKKKKRKEKEFNKQVTSNKYYNECRKKFTANALKTD